ncbi:HDOD domain-containing protein [Colwellia sp. BRX8-7]|jgi:HD-like signal output (HDOD) protein|uniref:HDOD domain-containing protein n=1 Tax=Colwellia sp. BRX8-7 TaxID=2759833 RepID=UPI0015F74F00|nr:HDOD domain-containing protein [Colwellia sp. BRX8-7]MBA6336968.1 HDOD domain-containing protein [Colwellia sp. BRX8-7]|tara:strand:- start:1947 stop:2798 length:852 start_codon:yes stop_codon:yes gene_type:complete
MLEVDDKVLADIRRGFSIPAQPSLLIKLQKIMAEDEPDVNALADIISQDVGVASIILKTINSPLYGLSRSISDIHKSVRYIGLQGINSLVTNTLIKRSFDQQDCSIALEEFWDSATHIANTCVHIGKTIKEKTSKDKLFSLGLFHDCGIPIMAMKYSDYNDTYQLAYSTPDKTLPITEDQAYGVNHATIGYYVASSWRLPKDICELILIHHDRDFLKMNNPRGQEVYYAILKLAENLVHNHKHCRDSADWPYVQEMIFTLLDIDEDNYQDYLEDSESFDVKAD